MVIASFEEYKNLFNHISPKSISDIIKICRENLDGPFRSAPWNHPDLNRGKALLNTQEALSAYLAAYGLMHIAKLALALRQNILLSQLKDEISIIDWGCGQGLGAAVALNYLKILGKDKLIQNIHLVEPSNPALERATFHLQLLAQAQDISPKIIPHNKYLPSKPELLPEISSLELGEPIILHIFSNILDVEAIDLYSLAELISKGRQQHIFICVAPLYSTAKQRTIAYSNYFTNKENFQSSEYSEIEYGGHKTATAHIVNFDVTLPILTNKGSFLTCNLAASYQSDLLQKEKTHLEEALFKVSAPFDFGLISYSDVHPILAVLSNIIVRGLPTRLSPYLEERIAEYYEISLSSVSPFEISYTCIDDLDNRIVADYKSICKGIAWVQRTILELIIGDKLAVSATEIWHIAVIERDVPIVIWALEDLRQQWTHLSLMSRDYKAYQMPDCRVYIEGQHQLSTTDPHLKTIYTPNIDSRREYSLVLDIACKNESAIQVPLMKARVKNDAYIIIRPSTPNEKTAYNSYRNIITSDKIYYDELCAKNLDGTYRYLENIEHIKYFLQLLFRKKDFRPGQIPIISRAIQHKSVIGLLPTGGGKSITYQIAALLQPGVTLVIDPLVALMQDQYLGLLRGGIDCCAYINSTQDDSEKRAVLSGMYTSRYQIVFISPERLAIPKFRQHMKEMHRAGVYFAYGVIDEVHCVSEWGHDFRFDYLHLGRNLYQHVLPKQKGEHISLFGLTATASFDVLADVERELSGDNAFSLDNESVIRYENTNRLELQYRIVPVKMLTNPRDEFQVFEAKQSALASIIPKLTDWFNELQMDSSHQYIREKFIERETINNEEILDAISKQEFGSNLETTWLENNHGAMVVFTPHRKGRMGVANSTSSGGSSVIGIQALVSQILPNAIVSGFVGGDDLNIVENFVAGKSNVMVATKAFGMGIDKANIRFTINACMSGSLEGFVQEAGRAGRDRKMALSIIVYSPSLLPDGSTADNRIHKFFYGNNFRGSNFEKRVMFELMSKHPMSQIDEESTDSTQGVFAGFLEQLEQAEEGSEMIFELSYKRPRSLPKLPDNASHELKQFYNQYYGDAEENYCASIKKAIYRMCCIGLISDYMQDYGKGVFIIKMVRREQGGYYRGLENFLLRYYTQERVGLEIATAKTFKGATELMKCLGYLTDFIYSKIATKRKRAIEDMEYFCKFAVEQEERGVDWKSINEDLKDYLYYYFNSKFARSGYTTDNGEAFSLGDDSNWGKVSTPEILLKYLRVIDDDVVGTHSPRDNIKHLQGAVRLLRRGATDDNPALDWLIVYCYLFEDSYKIDSLREDMKQIYIQGYKSWKSYFSETADFYLFVEQFHKEINSDTRQTANPDEIKLLSKWRLEAEVILQSIWIEKFSKTYGK